jgi:exocyst complex component 4
VTQDGGRTCLAKSIVSLTTMSLIAVPSLDVDNSAGVQTGDTPRLSVYLSSLVDRPQDYRTTGYTGTTPRSRSSAVAHSSSNTSSSATPSDLPISESFNPEGNSFHYIEVLLESLGVLGRLGAALDTVAQRVTAELHSLVETTLDEVEER